MQRRRCPQQRCRNRPAEADVTRERHEVGDVRLEARDRKRHGVGRDRFVEGVADVACRDAVPASTDVEASVYCTRTLSAVTSAKPSIFAKAPLLSSNAVLVFVSTRPKSASLSATDALPASRDAETSLPAATRSPSTLRKPTSPDRATKSATLAPKPVTNASVFAAIASEKVWTDRERRPMFPHRPTWSRSYIGFASRPR